MSQHMVTRAAVLLLLLGYCWAASLQGIGLPCAAAGLLQSQKAGQNIHTEAATARKYQRGLIVG
jgi:hypothetical protein